MTARLLLIQTRGMGTEAERSCIARRVGVTGPRDLLWSPLPSEDRNLVFPQALSKHSGWHSFGVSLSWGAFAPCPRTMALQGSEEGVPVPLGEDPLDFGMSLQSSDSP